MKRLFVRGTLALLVLWPLTQHVLHRTHAVGAWKLFGLGVYCRPKLPVRLEVEVDGAPWDLRGATSTTHEALVALRERTRELGTLASATEAGCRVRRDEAAGEVAIVRVEDRLDGDGRIRTRRDTWRVDAELCAAYTSEP
ncbi:MAG: hypothetical protein H6723_19905 [Sandaracinus sp.]|nr:hypothetical protein [Sandaracinus sp.]